MSATDESRPDTRSKLLTAIIVVSTGVFEDSVESAVRLCAEEVDQVVVALVHPAVAKSDSATGDSDLVRAASVVEAVRTAARTATTRHCVVVDARRPIEPGSMACFAHLSEGDIACGARSSPDGRTDLPDGPAVSALLRQRTIALPTNLLAAGMAVVDLDDVITTFRSFDQLAANGVRFLAVPLPSGRASGWTSRDAMNFGREAVELYRESPASLHDTGLDRYRTVSYLDHLRRRLALVRRLPRAGSASSTAFWQGVRAESSRVEWSGLTAATTVLMYHGFTDEAIGSRYVVGRQRLRRHLNILRRTRRHVISLHDYIEARRVHGFVPGRSVVITIDDGYADTYSVAAPELRGAGVTATLFVPTAHVGGVCDWSTDSDLSGRRLASWEQLSAGLDTIDIGSHAHHHVALAELDDEAVDIELARSSAELFRLLGRPVRAFAYPYGADSQRTRARVEQSQFIAACTSHGGRNSVADSLHSVRRVEVRGDVSTWAFIVAVFTGSTVPIHRQLRGRR